MANACRYIDDQVASSAGSHGTGYSCGNIRAVRSADTGVDELQPSHKRVPILLLLSQRSPSLLLLRSKESLSINATL